MLANESGTIICVYVSVMYNYSILNKVKYTKVTQVTSKIKGLSGIIEKKLKPSISEQFVIYVVANLPTTA